MNRRSGTIPGARALSVSADLTASPNSEHSPGCSTASPHSTARFTLFFSETSAPLCIFAFLFSIHTCPSAHTHTRSLSIFSHLPRSLFI